MKIYFVGKWLGLDQTGLDWTGLNWIRQDRNEIFDIKEK